jgi:hypothetical protein
LVVWAGRVVAGGGFRSIEVVAGGFLLGVGRTALTVGVGLGVGACGVSVGLLVVARCVVTDSEAGALGGLGSKNCAKEPRMVQMRQRAIVGASA